MIYQRLSKFIDGKTLAFDLIRIHTHTHSLSLYIHAFGVYYVLCVGHIKYLDMTTTETWLS